MLCYRLVCTSHKFSPSHGSISDQVCRLFPYFLVIFPANNFYFILQFGTNWSASVFPANTELASKNKPQKQKGIAAFLKKIAVRETCGAFTRPLGIDRHCAPQRARPSPLHFVGKSSRCPPRRAALRTHHHFLRPIRIANAPPHSVSRCRSARA